MARTPMVTRTIQTTKCNVLCVDITEGKTFDQNVTLARTYKDEAATLKAIKAVVDNDTVKLVAVKSVEVCETLYGMTEQDFIEKAEILPPRKVYGDKDGE